MDKIKLEILGLSSSQSQSGSFALVLGEEDGNRRLPIIIGMFEAQAIAIEIEKIIPNRPMTHDLFKSFGDVYGFVATEVIISDLKEGVFFAKIMCVDKNGNENVVDARPSDAIAIGLRFDVDIYTYETILSEAGIILSDEENEEVIASQPVKDINEPIPGKGKALKDMSVPDLNKILNEAITNENYEEAAKIRDELSRRN